VRIRKTKTKDLADIKAAVRARDGYRCVRCGKTEERYVFRGRRRQLSVHRKVPGSEYSLEGCETLCASCHRVVHKELGTYKNRRYPRHPRPSRVSPEEISELMRLRNWSIEDLAKNLVISGSGVRSWLRRRTNPRGPAGILMQIWLDEARKLATARNGK
jgi:DNA-binding transcriptional regulator YiaG